MDEKENAENLLKSLDDFLKALQELSAALNEIINPDQNTAQKIKVKE